MPEKEKDIIQSRTEEVQDIIEKMPGRTSAKVAVVILATALLMVALGFIIKYPESISGPVTVSANQAPIRLVAQVSGKIHLLEHIKNENIIENQAFAYIESSVDIEQILLLDSLLNLNNALNNNVIDKRSACRLGSLTMYFLEWERANETYKRFEKSNTFEIQLQLLDQGIENLYDKIDFLKQQLILQEKSYTIAAKNITKDSIQFYELKTITETQYYQTKASGIGQAKQLNSLKEDLRNTKASLIEQKTIREKLLRETFEYKTELQNNVNRSYNDLKTNLQQWKEHFLFWAPYSGKLEMLGFWREGEFIAAGKELFTVLPKENPVFAEMQLPEKGAGKVKEGQEVIIKLDNYPYLQYGSLLGHVESVSTITNQTNELLANNNIKAYLVKVKLPNQLVTNYGRELQFVHDLSGSAQILTKKRKLIERLFDNLKYITNN